MCTKRDALVFLAGAAAFHTLSHILMPAIVPLPLHVLSFNFTAHMNMLAIAANALITIGLLYWAHRLEK